MDPALPSQLAKPYTSIDDVITAFTALEAHFIAHQDRRAVFLSAYNTISHGIRQAIEAKEFHDPAWVHAYGTTFGNLYRQALLAYETGGRPPGAWQVAFSESQSGKTLVIQDLILGIHAHVNRDLAFALESVGIDPDRPTRYADHTKVNDVLDATTNAMQNRIAQLYARGLGVLDRLLGPIDELTASFSVHAAREHAWHMGVALTDAHGTPARASLATHIDRQAKLLARTFLIPNVTQPWLIEALREVERALGWLSVLEHHDQAAT